MNTSKSKVHDFLSRLSLFSAIGPEALEKLVAETSELHLPRGAGLFQRGDPCLGFHCIIYGQVKLSFIANNGAEKVMRIVGPGHSFGEAVMFTEKPYVVSAQALSDCLLLHVSKAAVFGELDVNPQFARKMLAGLSQRLHGLVCDVEAYSLRSGTQRVIGYLLQGEAYADGEEIRLSVSKTVIASRLNLTPEHFSRILHDLSESRLIVVSGRSITICDVEKLRMYEV